MRPDDGGSPRGVGGREIGGRHVDPRDVSRRAVVAGLLAAALAACSPRPTQSSTGSTSAAPTSAAPTATPEPVPPPPPPLPPVEVMAGQMLMLGFPGTTLDRNPVVAELTERHLGSVILFGPGGPSGGNVSSPDQVAGLTGALRAVSPEVLVAVDQEGGRVARLGPGTGFPATRSAAALGATGDPAVTRAASAEIARTLRQVGIGLNLAPVVDVNTYAANPIIGAVGRSFSSDPAVVAEHAAAFVQGHHDEGVLTSLKHFPGHGSSRGDTHTGFVDVTPTWDPLELEPYRSLLAAGLADSVMVAHVFNSALDGDYPASLSPATINGLLRGELGFGGVVISDDLIMGAITQRWGFEEAVRRAVLAGADVLSIGSMAEDRGRRAHETIVGMVAAGEVSEARLLRSYDRVRALKARAA